MINCRRFTGFRRFVMGIFFENLWIWIALTFVVGVCGYTWYQNAPKVRNLAIAVLLPFLTFALGCTLYYGVDSDQKTIARMLDALVAAVEGDDIDSVCQFISPTKGQDTMRLAKTQMGLVLVSRAKYRDLQIEINDAASPPIAKVRFSAMFYWKTKAPIAGFMVDQPVPEPGRFEIELIKTKSKSWLLTDKFNYYSTNLP